LSIPLRQVGETGVQISALGLGGHDLGGAKDEKTAIEIVHRALDGGTPFTTMPGNTIVAKPSPGCLTGTGMGLRVSRSIIEAHGGHLWAADRSPRGASFYFTLPTNGETNE